jgi:hypothetical protein
MGHTTADMTTLYTGEIPVEELPKNSFNWIQMEQPKQLDVVVKYFVGAGDGNRTNVRSLGSFDWKRLIWRHLTFRKAALIGN